MIRALAALPLVFAILGGLICCADTALAAERLRVGVLKFGTVNWQLDSLKAGRFDAAQGLELEVLPLASKNATAVALQAGEVDMIVSDWIWALRQRAAGTDFLFAPYSTALGALVLRSGLEMAGIGDLAGKRIGVAGGPIDKSWLVLRSWSQSRLGLDLAEAAEPVFAAPPLLNEQLRMGKLDAVLTYWPYAARLEAAGFVRLAAVGDLLTDLGIEGSPALVGYVFRQDLAREKPAALEGFFRALAATNDLLARSDAEWERLRPIMKVGSNREFEALKAGFRAGIPALFMDAKGLVDARTLFRILAETGGDRLVGAKTSFDPAVFWTGPKP